MGVAEKEIDMENINNLENTNNNPLWQFNDVSVLMKNGEPSKFTTSLSAYELASLEENKILYYNPNTQRGLRIVRDKEVPIVNITKVGQIYYEMSKYSLNGGTITLNYSQTNEEKENPTLNYDSENRNLYGLKPLEISDGMHRTMACKLWKKNWIKVKRKIFLILIYIDTMW